LIAYLQRIGLDLFATEVDPAAAVDPAAKAGTGGASGEPSPTGEAKPPETGADGNATTNGETVQ
jgi:hypothetical protein